MVEVKRKLRLCCAEKEDNIDKINEEIKMERDLRDLREQSREIRERKGLLGHLWDKEGQINRMAKSPRK